MKIKHNMEQNKTISGLTKELAIYIVENHLEMVIKEGKKGVEDLILLLVENACKTWSLHALNGVNEDAAWEIAHKEAYEELGYYARD